MSWKEQRDTVWDSAQEPEPDPDFEEQLRELLARDADAVRPAPAPYPAIRRRGVAERRRRVAVAGATLLALAAMPVGAYATGVLGSGTTAPELAVGTQNATATEPAAPATTASGPARPASDGQLLDGITFAQAADGLETCLAAERPSAALRGNGTGKAKDYRIILAMKSTGDSNAPGDGMFVVGVKDGPERFRVVCNIVDGVASGISTSSSDADPPNAGPVVADINAGKLYQQSVIDKGNWKLPFRWGMIGTVEASVAKVTVSYGDSVADPAVLDHGWFVAAGVIDEQVTEAPHIMGYDTDGKLVYDSDTDSTYDRALP
ncbi:MULTISPECIES: hypothetical protein [Streptomyces]|uniref:Uncharacterized protein n=2 Tax=Streptomyces TaxID=1883 RepID=A0ABV9J229_9ACTN